MPPDITKEDMLIEIKDRGMYYWKENIKLLNDMKGLELPNAIIERNNKLTKYCELRIKAYELIYKQIDEDSEQYKNQIEGYDKQIGLVVNELSGKNK
jgi:rhomboid protease GluP